jgi:integrase
MNVERQSKIYIAGLQNRKRDPAKPRTIQAYESYLKTWIVPELGAMDLADVKNGTMKAFVAKLAAAGLKPASIAGVTNCVKGIVKSAVNAEGEFLFPRQWNNDFIDAPPVNSRDQKAPVLSREALQEAISRTEGQFRALCILLAGTGMRISECLAVKKGLSDKSSYWDPEQTKIVIQSQTYHGAEGAPKSAAGYREIDLATPLNDYLKECFDEVAPGALLFVSPKGEEALSIDTANSRRAAAKIPGFHSFRRFRTTHLRASRVPEDIIQFWIGHAGKNITDRYSKMAQDVEARKKYAAETGLGFEIPKEAQ